MDTKKYSGFTLVEMAIVLLIIAGIMAIALPLTGTLIDNSNRAKTTTNLQAVQLALVNFVTQNKRLPCPADGAIPDGAAGAGVEARNPAGDCLVTTPGATVGQLRGVVPWVTLGINSTDAQDAWNNRITYRVPDGPYGVTHDSSLDMTGCDAAGGAAVVINGNNTAVCAAGCVSTTLATCTSPLNFLTYDNSGIQAQGKKTFRGLQVSDGAGNCSFDPFTPAAGTSAPTGAAYVLIAHGTNRAGAYTAQGNLLPNAGASPPSGTAEQFNFNGLALRLPATANACVGPGYVNAQFSEGATTNHFDDIVLSQTIMNLVTAAQLGPRAH